MSLAYTQASNDKTFISEHVRQNILISDDSLITPQYELLNTWVDYLVDNAMNPSQQ